MQQLKSQQHYSAAQYETNPQIKEKHTQAGHREFVNEKLSFCDSCSLSCMTENKGGRRAYIGGLTPSFVCFVSGNPDYEEIQNGLSGTQMAAWSRYLKALLPIVGFDETQVSFISSIGCFDRLGGYPGTNPCRENLSYQMSVVGAKVFVLMGDDAARRCVAPTDIEQAHGSWVASGEGVSKRYFFFIRHPRDVIGNARKEFEMKNDFNALGGLIHIAWCEHVQNQMPYDKVEITHQLGYEQICTLVAGMIKYYLLNLTPGQRTAEFMKIMARVCHISEGEANAVRAFWDAEFAAQIGVDVGEGMKQIANSVKVNGMNGGWVP